ncbi:hypothetical protein Dimus_006063 [Dionaea muscipula]
MYIGYAHWFPMHCLQDLSRRIIDGVLNILDYGLAKTADLFIKHAMSPATNLRSPTTFVVESNDDSGRSFGAVL